MIKFSQHSFSGGQIDRDLMGRQDLAKYFTGASTLRNFVVKKQGFLAKRRGTNLVCDLSALPEIAEKAYKTRLIPFCYEKTGGFLLLFLAERSTRASKIYICSGRGILFTDGVWRDMVEGATNDAGEAVSPVALEVPYIGSELDSLGYAQSGDTLYIAHPNYPFATITRVSNTFTYKAIDFRKQGADETVYPPTITASGSGNKSTGATKTISYVATYVKDGVESAPSAPCYISYKLPWDNTFEVTLTTSKGANKTEPDYYNIYKKSESDYGYIGNTENVNVSILAQITGSFCVQAEGDVYGSYTKSQNETAVRNAFMSGGLVSSVQLYRENALGEMEPYYLSAVQDGIYLTDATIENAGTAAKFTFYANVYTSAVTETTVSGKTIQTCVLRRGASGSKPTLTATYTNKAGKTNALTKDCSFINEGTTSPWKAGEYERVLWTKTTDATGETEIKSYCTEEEFQSLLFFERWECDLTAEVDKWDSTATLTSISFRAFPVSHMELNTIAKRGNTMYDDYITPDVSMTPPKDEDHFHVAGKYPSCVCLYTQRLALANTHQQPFTLFLSTAGDLYNFNTHDSVREDDAIEATVPATEFPEINHLVVAKDLVVLCDNGEWVVSPSTGNTLSLKTIQIKQQSRIGCSKRLQPIYIGEEIVIAEATSETLRAMRYNWTVDGYESQDLSVLAADITRQNPIVDFAYKQHPDTLIVCVLEDGTMGVLAYMKEQELCAWSVCELGGGLKALGVASDKSIVNGTTGTYILAKDEYREKLVLLRIRDDVDASTLEKAACLDVMSIIETEPEPEPEPETEDGEASTDGEATEETTADATDETTEETDETAEDAGDTTDEEQEPEPVIVVPEGVTCIDLVSGKEFEEGETLEAGRRYAVGYRFEALFRSIHPEMQSEQTMQFELKGLKNLELRLAEAGSCEIVQTELEDATMNQWVSVPTVLTPSENGEIDLPEKTVVVDAAQRADSDGRVSIRSRSAYPLHILSFSANYEFDPRLMGQRG